MPEVNLVERVEGHVGLDIEVEAEEKEKVNFSIQEGPRLFESFLKGREYNEIPFFASRICGFCPIVHNLSAIKALENALGVSPPEEVSELRRALNLMEFIQSHSAHLYMLTLPDFVDSKDDLFGVGEEFPDKVKEAVQMRKEINSLIETLSGRAVHPLTTRVGGFSKVPNEDEMKEGIERLEGMEPAIEETVDLFAGLDYPDFEADTRYVSLGRDDGRYPTYDGHVISSEGEKFDVDEYSDMIKEETKSYSTAKFSSIDDEPFLTGAISRVNLNKKDLSENAKSKLKEVDIDFPSSNPYHNNVAQAIEIIHSVDEIKSIYSDLLGKDLSEAELLGEELKESSAVDVKAGKGVDSVEAPRGTLYHYYEVDENGFVKDTDILTPTAQSAANIERDINLRWSELGDSSNKKEEIKSLVRAYDPCISCSVH